MGTGAMRQRRTARSRRGRSAPLRRPSTVRPAGGAEDPHRHLDAVPRGLGDAEVQLGGPPVGRVRRVARARRAPARDLVPAQLDLPDARAEVLVDGELRPPVDRRRAPDRLLAREPRIGCGRRDDERREQGRKHDEPASDQCAPFEVQTARSVRARMMQVEPQALAGGVGGVEAHALLERSARAAVDLPVAREAGAHAGLVPVPRGRRLAREQPTRVQLVPLLGA